MKMGHSATAIHCPGCRFPGVPRCTSPHRPRRATFKRCFFESRTEPEGRGGRRKRAWHQGGPPLDLPRWTSFSVKRNDEKRNVFLRASLGVLGWFQTMLQYIIKLLTALHSTFSFLYKVQVTCISWKRPQRMRLGA